MIETSRPVPVRTRSGDLLTVGELAAIRQQVRNNQQTGKRFPRLRKVIFRDAAIISLLLAGVTAREICSLERKDLNLAKKQLRIGNRALDLDANTADYLAAYLDTAPASPWLFVSQRGRVLDIRSVRRAAQAIGRETGIYLET